MGSIVSAAKPFEAFATKAEQYFAAQFPQTLEHGGINQIFVGRNKDGAAGERAGYRVTGAAVQANGNYLELPERQMPLGILSDPMTGRTQLEVRVSDSVKNYWLDRMHTLMDARGMSETEAKASVQDGTTIIGYYDGKTGHYVAEAIVPKVNDAAITSLVNAQVPYWNISYLNKIYKQPFLRGYAKNLVSTLGVPNIWADAISVYTETFEGFARAANVGKTTVEFNLNETVKNRSHQILSELTNFVIEFETSPMEGIYAGLNGNPLGSVLIGDREKYARLMLEQMHNAAIYFGIAGVFDGLAQMAAEETWPSAPMQYIWSDPANTTRGADIVEALNTMLGDLLEGLNFMPTSININVSPTAYKALKWTMQSKVYNPTNPLTVLSANFGSSEKIVGTLVKDAGDSLQSSYNLVPDPMLAPNTPWNPDDADLMYITLPSVQSEMEDMKDLIIAPVAIENYILPNVWPGRDGLLRTMLKRVGSLIAPVDGLIKIVRGFGVNPDYTP
jgi:hypothetical protein